VIVIGPAAGAGSARADETAMLTTILIIVLIALLLAGGGGYYGYKSYGGAGLSGAIRSGYHCAPRVVALGRSRHSDAHSVDYRPRGYSRATAGCCGPTRRHESDPVSALGNLVQAALLAVRGGAWSQRVLPARQVQHGTLSEARRHISPRDWPQ
jgi:hypothetical protein